MQQVNESLKGHIIISKELENEIEQLEKRLSGHRVVKFIEETFKIEHAKEVMAAAYVSESSTKYIILAAIDFTDVAQNSLLKLLEEPPTNIEFVIITTTKSTLLPTIRSRLPILKVDTTHDIKDLEISLARLDYEQIFSFLKANSRISKNEAKELIESLFYKAVVVEKLILSQKQLETFDKAYRLVELNSRPQSVFAMLLMGFTQER
ncbi:DNA polymerase III subunit delta' [Sulfurimonas marina]|uniref:DNA polymerase III subunit delta n=1 Tax=Sulfurimonas marina TaxID=2590551 RepID=A0A7M1ATA0_9BACT|nr:DNA polymerase III subunit delta' [Sulfurimonas marina]QOP40620.1 DNA polymerase III subunit delta' [Sulfurimonas marina]